MDTGGFLDWRQLYETALNELKAVSHDLPPNGQREAIEQKIRHLEDMLARADAVLAKELSAKLCDCTWPPKPMLWVEAQKAHVCQNPSCGRRREQAQAVRVSRQSNWVRARREGWMDN